MTTKYLDSNGLLYLWQKIRNTFVSDITWDSTNRKLVKKKKTGTGGAEESTDIVTLATVATSGSYSDLSNKPTIPAAVQPTTTTPKMDGTASVGSETKYAKGDHVHPSDTSRVPTTRTVNGNALSDNIWIDAAHIPCEDGENDVEAALAEKVDKETGKGLSTNDYTTAEKNKLNGIAAGAEVNVQSDWNQTTTTADDYIKNKPTIPSQNIWYATCSSDGDAVAKVATTTSGDFVLATGNMVRVKFENGNTINNGTTGITLNVDGTGATKMAFRSGIITIAHVWQDGEVVDFVYDGTRFVMSNKARATTSFWGLTMLSTSTSSAATDIAATSSAVKNAYDLASSKAGLDSPAFTGTPTAPTATAGTNNTQIANTAFVKNAVDTAVTGAVAYQGIAPTSFAPTNYKAGWYWIVGTAGTYAGQVCEAGDMIFCKTAASTYAAANFDVVQTNLDITSITNAEIDTIVAA